MSDPRITPFSGRVAHISLKGQVEAERFVEGDLKQVDTDVAGLYLSPDDATLDRQLLSGQRFLVIDTHDDGDLVYGMAARDSYCGWVDIHRLRDAETPTHRIVVRESFVQQHADLKSIQMRFPMFFGSEVRIDKDKGDWSQLSSIRGPGSHVPSRHLAPIERLADDPVDVARLFLGTPYLWGGNSGRGIDCSGLVQAAYLACGIPCPGDSDMQQGIDGVVLDKGDALASGDLMFWKGHVAMATGPSTMIHANAHHMAVVEEPIYPALARMVATDTGAVTLRLRPNPRGE